MKQLVPIFIRDKYTKLIEDDIDQMVRELIYRPLMKLMDSPHPEYHNANDALFDAITNGTIWYENGHFYGHFNAATTKRLKDIGALYHTRSKTWSLEMSEVPTDLKMAQANADSRYDALTRGFMKILDDIKIDAVDNLSKVRDSYKKVMGWMDSEFVKTMKGITIPPTMTEEMKSRIAEEWGTNLDLYIKGWMSKNILNLRERVQQHSFEGRRAESLIKIIQSNYGVSQRKAKFLARQETSLLLSKFRETRYAEVGVKRYRWSTAHDERVRSDHSHLNGKIFSFDSPPVTNTKTGARNNPGEDFGCRCIAVALVE